MAFEKLITQFKKIFIGPKVYAVLFEAQGLPKQQRIYLSTGYSLENVWKKFVSELPNTEEKRTWSPILWEIRPFKNLTEGFNVEIEEPEQEPEFEDKPIFAKAVPIDSELGKNLMKIIGTDASDAVEKEIQKNKKLLPKVDSDKKIVIQKILTKKDKKLLESSKEILTDEEYVYLKSRINERS